MQKNGCRRPFLTRPDLFGLSLLLLPTRPVFKWTPRILTRTRTNTAGAQPYKISHQGPIGLHFIQRGLITLLLIYLEVWMHVLFYLELELEGGRSETVRVPAPSDLLLRIENTLSWCSIYLCGTRSEILLSGCRVNRYRFISGSQNVHTTITPLLCLFGRRKLYVTYYTTTGEILEVYYSMQSSNRPEVPLIPRVRVEAGLYIRHQECFI